MEKRGHRFYPAAAAVLAGALTLSGGISQETQSANADFSTPTSHTLVLPEVAMAENIPQCKQTVILYADGLSGSRAGHMDRAFFQPIIAMADALNTPIQSITADNLRDPEKNEMMAKLHASLKTASEQNQQAILVGYSMGSRIMVEFLATLSDPANENYDPTLLDAVTGAFLIGGRNENPAHANNYSGLTNYPAHFRNRTSPEVLKSIKERLNGKLFAFAEMDDDIVPASQTKLLSQELGAEFITVDAPGTHFVSKESGIPIADRLNDVLPEIERNCLTPTR